nr:hypothetical protein [Prolixibacteraceae bacterium]
TIDRFIAGECEKSILTISEMQKIRGGDSPTKKPGDPFSTKSFHKSMFPFDIVMSTPAGWRF